MNSVVCSALFLSVPPPCGERVARAGCDVELCGYATRIMEATHLIHLGARAGLVCQLTQLEKATVNRLYRQFHGVPSPPGQMPFTDSWYRRKRCAHVAGHTRLAATPATVMNEAKRCPPPGRCV
ncbi:MAG TPA: hypothetical protein ENK51_05710 [Gammaproteobacteria bacterium]|nr:hypothetical protein [Gammaproteobacteria bacterium]